MTAVLVAPMLFVLTQSASGDAATPVNLVTNPSFEGGGLQPAAWTLSTGAGAGDRSSLTSYEGSYSLELVQALPASPVVATSATFPVGGGDLIVAQLQVNDQLGAMAASITVQDSLGRTIMTQPLVPAAPGPGWVLEQASFTSPSAASFGHVVIAMRGIGRSFADAASVIDIPPLPVVVTDDFSNGLTAWTSSNGTASIDCSTGLPACSARLAPDCCGSKLRLYREVDVPLRKLTRFDFDIMRSAAGISTDAQAVVIFYDGTAIILAPTAGSSNTGLYLALIQDHAIAFEETFASSSAVGVWDHGAIIMDSHSGTFWAEWRGPSGALVARSSPHALPAAARQVQLISLEGAAYSPEQTMFWFDNIRVANGQ